MHRDLVRTLLCAGAFGLLALTAAACGSSDETTTTEVTEQVRETFRTVGDNVAVPPFDEVAFRAKVRRARRRRTGTVGLGVGLGVGVAAALVTVALVKARMPSPLVPVMLPELATLAKPVLARIPYWPPVMLAAA